MIPMYNTMLFTNVWDNVENFKTDVKLNPLSVLNDNDLEVVFYLLYAQYGNSPIANFDVEQFKFKVYSVIYKYGPSWSKRVEIQKKLRELSDEELSSGTRQITNHAYNPSTAPSTSTINELPKIDEQHANKTVRGKMDAYAFLWDLLATDVTSEFINRFKICFKQFVMPERPVLYVDESEDD